MVLHFNYHVSEIFYGIEILKPGANGTIPLTAHLTKNIFYHIPILIVLSLLSFNHKAFRLIHLILSALFSIAHLQHLFTELKQNTYDLSQLPLLSIVLLISLMI